MVLIYFNDCKGTEKNAYMQMLCIFCLVNAALLVSV